MNSAESLKEKITELEGILENKISEIELLEAAFNLAEVGFTLSNAEGVVLRVNEAQVRITGHEPEKTLGRSMAEIEKENRNQSATMQVVATGKPVTIEQTLPSGKSYLVYGQPWFDSDHRLKYVVCCLIDNTHHNYTRQALEAAERNNTQLEASIRKLQEIMDIRTHLIYRSEKMQTLVGVCDKIASYNSTVLIEGSTGAGKEVLADYIYHKSARAHMPFIKINCAAIPENLLESEFFGYEAGAFTSASSRGKEGIFETANGGTVLLDEIGDLPFSLQSKLLRVLQQGEFYHVGGVRPIQADVRIIAATNQGLEDMAAKGKFRKDLYYRLSVIKIKVPALSERRDDIPLLIKHFIKIFNAKYNLQKDITFDAMEYLTGLPYPGNVRDLQNVVERMLLLSGKDIIDAQDAHESLGIDVFDSGDDPAAPDQDDVSLKELLARYEKKLLQSYWDTYKTTTKIAQVLRTSQPTISRKLSAYGISQQEPGR